MTEADNSDVVLMVIIFSACFNQALSLGIRFYSYYYYHCKNNYYYNIFIIIIMYSIYSVMGGGNGWGAI